MANETQFPGDVRTKGRGIFGGGVSLAAGDVTDATIPAAANLPASKLEQQHSCYHKQAAGAAVVTMTENVHIVRGATGLLISVDAMVDTAPTGADRTITIDVLKGNQGAGFTTLLSAPIVLNNTTAAREVKTATLIGNPATADGDTIRVVVTVAGAAGAQGQGLNVTVMLREKADP